ncbi:hypothetical protein FRACYDRAFT_237449 [Fragilariopsis cylindrus CCMP1102]|uniref:Uncharacterized protein n=1 Tax=Fragilariopsis cylindrus CCMP1102 TaxID=635003 RepID=A0A1E7FLV7_9STRA|nr:hypothetical protein FRACYDRAFT_237449 [Fragilariopsis cylindrus CCMP1102]|eukprot:OEU19158.1 hypothetical protein FRACYDRAFT_237449 [Fragilariopsis cylindrus CCMP1102]
MQNPELTPVLGPVASPLNENNRLASLDLSTRKINLNEEFKSLVDVDEDGRVDVDASVELFLQYNNALEKYERDEGLLTIIAEAASRVDAVHHDLVRQIIIYAGIDKWKCRTTGGGLRHIGKYAGFILQYVARFGALSYREIYELCGQVYGGNTVCDAVKRLVSRNYLHKFRFEGELQYQLGPRLAHILPVSGTRRDRDVVAFEAASEAGRVVIANRRAAR